MNYSLNKNSKIKNKKEINCIFKNGSFVKSDYYFCRYLKNNKDFSRIAIIIKKKNGNSVKRNYEKRIIREFFRQYRFRIKQNRDIIVIVKRVDGSFRNKLLDFNRMINLINNNA